MLREQNTNEDYFIRMEPWYHQASTVSVKAGAADDNVIFTRFEKSVCLNTREEPIVEIHDFKELYHLDDEIGAVIFDLDDTLYSEKGQLPLETVLKEAGIYSDELLLRCKEAIRDYII